MSKPLKLILWGLLLLLIGVFSGCGEQKPAQIKLGMLPIADNLPFWVAEQKGYFQAEGIEVELIAFPSALVRDSAFTAKQIDAAIGDLLAVATMNNSGIKVKAVAIGQGIKPGENRFAILSAPKSEIRVAGELQNVPIAMSLNTVNEYITDQLLVDQGLTSKEIKKVAIPKLPVRLEALMGGTVQAATLPDPMATLAEINGAHLIIDNTKKTIAQTVVIARQETLDTNLVGLQKLLKAYTKAVADIQADSGQFSQLLAEKAKIPEKVMQDQTYLQRLSFSATQLPVAEDIEAVGQWMIDHKLLENKPSYEEMVDRRVIEE